QADRLPSWKDGAIKRAILDFVVKVTTAGGADFVPPPERIATFDNDGTLWTEQPNYVQAIFAQDRVRALADRHPEWKTQEHFKWVLEEHPAPISSIRRHDRGNAQRHHPRGFPRGGAEVAGHRASSALRAAVHRVGLPADAGAAGSAARQPVQDLHRLRRRGRVHAAVDRTRLRHSP